MRKEFVWRKHRKVPPPLSCSDIQPMQKCIRCKPPAEKSPREIFPTVVHGSDRIYTSEYKLRIIFYY